MIARPIRQAEFGEPIPVTNDDMLNEISNQGPAVPAVMDSVQPQLEALDPSLFAAASHIYITGCGDSYFAGLAARYAFARYAGVPTDALEALEFGRYAAEYLPPDSLVFGISNSGKATRSVEAAVNARLGGAHTVAITGNPDGWLAQESDTILDQSVRLDGELIGMPSNLATDTEPDKPRRGSFGLVNYLASLTTLYLTAFHTGVVRGNLTEAEAGALRAELRTTADLITQTVDLCTPAAKAYAEKVKEVDSYTILGSGPSLATSLFYAAKTYELPRVYGVSQELEEWAHEQYFLTGPGTQVLFIAPQGRSISRVRELLHTTRTMGGTGVVVADESNAELAAAADVKLPVAGNVQEALSPLVYCVPGQLFATFLARSRGRLAFEFDSPLQYEMNMRTIQESQLIEFHPALK
ncbi:MAG: SIS domain-containing protein [Caldilineaceae bacterium]|nr:SIS domain-containing protein [Caldilineaceae bacterium]